MDDPLSKNQLPECLACGEPLPTEDDTHCFTDVCRYACSVTGWAVHKTTGALMRWVRIPSRGSAWFAVFTTEPVESFRRFDPERETLGTCDCEVCLDAVQRSPLAGSYDRLLDALDALPPRGLALLEFEKARAELARRRRGETELSLRQAWEAA